MKFEEPMIIIQKDDVIASKKGFLQKSPISNKHFIFHKQKYLGDGKWMIIGDKEEVEVTKL